VTLTYNALRPSILKIQQITVFL